MEDFEGFEVGLVAFKYKNVYQYYIKV